MITWWLDLLPIAMLGAVLGLDVVSFPQAMLSRPIVAATLAGALLGAPVQGLVMGAVLELFALETLPVGASRYPEWGSASVVAGAIFAAEPPDRGGALAVATVVGLLTAAVGTYSMVVVRRLNGCVNTRCSSDSSSSPRASTIGKYWSTMKSTMV